MPVDCVNVLDVRYFFDLCWFLEVVEATVSCLCLFHFVPNKVIFGVAKRIEDRFSFSLDLSKAFRIDESTSR